MKAATLFAAFIASFLTTQTTSAVCESALVMSTYNSSQSIHKEFHLARLVDRRSYEKIKRRVGVSAIIYGVPVGANYDDFQARAKRSSSRTAVDFTQSQLVNIAWTGLDPNAPSAYRDCLKTEVFLQDGLRAAVLGATDSDISILVKWNVPGRATAASVQWDPPSIGGKMVQSTIPDGMTTIRVPRPSTQLSLSGNYLGYTTSAIVLEPLPQAPSPVLEERHKPARLFINSDYAKPNWRELASPPDEAIPVKFVAGENSRGAIIVGGADGRKVWYMSSYATNRWVQLPDAPFEVLGLAGNNARGPLIFGERDRRSVAFLKSYSSPLWTEVSVKAPFSINHIAGENGNGPIIAGGDAGRQVAYLRSYSSPQWVKIPSPGISISHLLGTNVAGPLVWDGESRNIKYLRDYSDPKWKSIPLPEGLPKKSTFLAGENSKGAILVVDGETSYYTIRDYGGKLWVSRPYPYSSYSTVGISGNNSKGPIVMTEAP